MRIPKPVNTVLDRAERHTGPLAAVIALAAAGVAAMWVPLLAGFILGIAFGGFAVHLRVSKRMARARKEVDDLLRENGLLRHRNNVLASGVITREAQVTQALVSIPTDDPLDDPLEDQLEDPQRTQKLPALDDEIVAEIELEDSADAGQQDQQEPADAFKSDPARDAIDVTGIVTPQHRSADSRRR